jgi:hypothetical protein
MWIHMEDRIMAAPYHRPMLTLHGASGTSYTFSLYQRGETLPSVCAVYVVLGASGTDTRVVYVGETEDCCQRHGNHHKEWCFKYHGATRIGVHYETSNIRRLAIERDLIANYHPPCND